MRFPQHRMGEGGEDTAIRSPHLPPLSPCTEPPLSASAEPSSHARAKASSAEPSPSAEASSAEPSPSTEASSAEPSPSAEASSAEPSPSAEASSAEPSPSAEAPSAEPPPSAEPTPSAEPPPSTEPPSSPINNQLPSKKPFVPKPPRRRKIGIGRKKKESKYNYGAARASLNAPYAHHFQVCSAAVSSNVDAVDETPTAISPTKEEVKAERDMLHSIAIDFECKLDSSSKKNESLESKSTSLSNSLKEEKLKSRTAIEQLLLVTTTQTNELIASFQDRFNKLKSNHDNSLR